MGGMGDMAILILSLLLFLSLSYLFVFFFSSPQDFLLFLFKSLGHRLKIKKTIWRLHIIIVIVSISTYLILLIYRNQFGFLML